MNSRLALLFFAAPLACAAANEAAPAVIRFANVSKDQLSGSFDSLAGERIVWNSPILDKPAPFWLKSVLEVILPTTLPEFNATHEATLTLMNGDSVRGQIAAITDDTVTLDTWYAGRLNFRRVMVKDVVIAPRPALVFSGPTSLDGWTQAAKQAAWTYENSALRTTASVGIGRDVGLPDECSIGFDIAWRGSLMLNFNFFADDVSSDSPALGYQVSCQGSFATIRRQNAGMQFGDPANIPEFKDNDKVRLELRASRSSGNICLYANGRCAAVWKDPSAAKGKFGKFIQFVPRGKDALRVSGIKVAAWDGILDEAAQEDAAMMGMNLRFQPAIANPEPTPKPATDGRMKLRNGDSIGGEVTAIVDGIISVKTPFAEVKLPVARVRNIILKPAELEEPIRRNGDVRAWFGDGSSLVFCLDSMTPDAITGHSQLFGTATFKLAAFNRIEFNIYDPQITDLRAKEGL
ncbi:MAG: hypothetical protein DVB26_04150 [Verrucomicrobia bacterium]|nr:MAG: hypothetical protein DVB26_04150 [Verrucomicrobiota bacterium]